MRSLSNADRLEQQYRDHIKAHGHITKDAFLGKLLSGEVIASDATVAPRKLPA